MVTVSPNDRKGREGVRKRVTWYFYYLLWIIEIKSENWNFITFCLKFSFKMCPLFLELNLFVNIFGSLYLNIWQPWFCNKWMCHAWIKKRRWNMRTFFGKVIFKYLLKVFFFQRKWFRIRYFGAVEIPLCDHFETDQMWYH